ncbi:MAG: hypothetical protein HW421_3865 [Ignavibacteria bacterium]|nr:hypothetical protein [Ignavibacteria bacterium]
MKRKVISERMKNFSSIGKLFYFLIFSLLIFNVCNAQNTRRELIIAHPWTILTALVNGEPIASEAITTYKEIFHPDGKVSDFQKTGPEVSGTWELAESDTKLIINKGKENEIVYDIISIDEDILKLSGKVKDESTGSFEKIELILTKELSKSDDGDKTKETDKNKVNGILK